MQGDVQTPLKYPVFTAGAESHSGQTAVISRSFFLTRNYILAPFHSPGCLRFLVSLSFPCGMSWNLHVWTPGLRMVPSMWHPQFMSSGMFGAASDIPDRAWQSQRVDCLCASVYAPGFPCSSVLCFITARWANNGFFPSIPSSSYPPTLTFMSTVWSQILHILKLRIMMHFLKVNGPLLSDTFWNWHIKPQYDSIYLCLSIISFNTKSSRISNS